MQNIIICEDSDIQANHLRQAVIDLNIPNCNCSVYNSTKELLEHLPAINAYSIFLLDVVMPEINGIDLAKKINQSHPHSCIIYVTAYLNTVTDAQDTDHCYFLLKKELDKRLPIAMKKAIALIKDTSKKILVTQGSEKTVIELDDILYLERVKRYTFIVTKEKKLRVKEDFEEIMPSLTQSFHRCHNSFIVNFQKVTSIKRDAFLIADTMIPISRSYAKKCNHDFHEYIVNII